MNEDMLLSLLKKKPEKGLQAAIDKYSGLVYHIAYGKLKNVCVKEDIEEHLLKAEDDIRNGRVKDAREVFKGWKEKYGI